ncbi:hypothetical protein B0W48_06765 [Pseudoalteromonas aliena]|uniref:Uncharacterized protein n=1 Tax=Pseudoalteromonas aliena TaxID=247523 RepID=A0A1Q2GWL4_9GAMM|nr:hypothetical protein [Pseudoalteromonas aliena]AQP99528.1 hypothetical protein B0W48_06765 [Pseudoalteromonas aliena]
MKVEIADCVLSSEPKLEEVYNQLIAFRKKHSLGYQSFLKIINNSKIKENLKRSFKSLFESNANMIRYKYTTTVVVKKTMENQIEVQHLNEVLSVKAFVVLENEHNDLNFLLAAISSVKQGIDLSKYYQSLWTVRGSGGCGDMPKLMEKLFDESINLSRIAAVHDSDKYHNESELQKAQLNIIAKATEISLQCITLEKREIENYIPFSVLDSVYNPKYPKLQAFKKLNHIQRSFYDMKEGFKKVEYSNAIYNGIFNNVCEDVLQTLKDGFGDNIASQAFSTKYFHLYSKQNLDLYDTDIYKEFKHIHDTISSLL